ncbi:fatty acid amide hydrolase-like [Olea europaea var. sylvestris]|uniref:fatty acid amide hydrolase-like n=1 Tax=Olea europaea var. sylvestris TaxID=158386 RepID=UPI000C1CF8DC|nr:fatty acid amide hydrolase-like [Olea europaea var. sylvestris]
MGKKKVMLPASEVDLSTVKYQYEKIEAPHLTGFRLKLFVKLLEAPLVGSLIISNLKKENKMVEILKNTVIPESPMFKPEFPPQEPETGVVLLEEGGNPIERVELALKCLPDYDPANNWNSDTYASFRYWKIRDYAYAYRSKLTTPSIVAERFISAIEVFNNKMPPAPLLISYDPEHIRKQAAVSTQRFEEGKPLSILDGIFVAIKDDIDCYPHPSNGGTTFFHKIRSVEEDAVSVSRLRSCGVILAGKANMHELGLGTTGNNPNYGYVMHSNYFTSDKSHPYCRVVKEKKEERRENRRSYLPPPVLIIKGHENYAYLIPEFLQKRSLTLPQNVIQKFMVILFLFMMLCVCHIITLFFRSLCDSGTVEIIGAITSTVEDAILVYAAILGSSIDDTTALKPSLPCLPDLSSHDSSSTLESIRLGRYTEWFNDVFSTDISEKCEDVLNHLSETYGCKTVEIVIPELREMRTAHLVSIGSEPLSGLNPEVEDG